MPTNDNIAAVRRVEKLERQILSVEPVRIVTRLDVYRRGPEPRCETIADVYRNAKLDPCAELIGSVVDLDVLIDAEQGVHLHRAGDEDPAFDALANGVRTIEVAISCYPEQVPLILSDAPITATEGGTRAGKTRILVWWLFRQWLLRGHGAGDGHEIEAVFWWVREAEAKLFKHAALWLMRLWPAEVFVGSTPNENTKNKSLSLIDGSRVDFKSAALSGTKAGTSLRSESCEAIVVDELSAIFNEENWREIKSRVAQTGGPIATATTPTAGHWSSSLELLAQTSEGAVMHARVDMFKNPWWPLARVWVDLLKDGALSAVELVEKVLCKPDQPAAADAAVTDPHVRRMRFGEKQTLGNTLWRCWSDSMIVKDQDGPRRQFEINGRKLDNVTGAVVGDYFGRSGRGVSVAGGKDFNVNPGVVVVYQLFGDPRRPHVLVIDEVSSVGPTITNALDVAKRYKGLCMFCDPTGAMILERHASHGASGLSDAEEMRHHGLFCEPANGSRDRKVSHLSQIDSLNVLHRAMQEGLFHVHARCSGVLRALSEMRAQGDGRISKTSGAGSISDQISAFGDALRYGLWPVYRELLAPAGGVHTYETEARSLRPGALQ